MKILVLNCGSSSIKYQLYSINGEPELLAKGILERIGMDNSELTHQPIGKNKFKTVIAISDHQKGIDLIIKTLKDKDCGVIKDENEIKAVGHRVAHGGENFSTSMFVDDNVIKDIEKCCELAPLHNPANLKGILSLGKLLPGIPQVAVFDTSFHHTIPDYAYLYGIPYKYYSEKKIRRYGFHGTSHKFVAEKACNILGKKLEDMKIITCHLGNGASITAINKGKSVDSSMGFTPVEGLIMGTRCGDLDLGILLYIMEKENLSLQDANNLINKKSGMLGLTGISYDMRDIENAADKGNKIAETSLQMYCYRVKKYIGGYAAAMNGVDLIIYTGGIGENSFFVREHSSTNMEYLGIDFDKEKNIKHRAEDVIITKPNSKTTVMIITTNEELVIAKDTLRIVKEKGLL